jgi:hypothetical protein
MEIVTGVKTTKGKGYQDRVDVIMEDAILKYQIMWKGI